MTSIEVQICKVDFWTEGGSLVLGDFLLRHSESLTAK